MINKKLIIGIVVIALIIVGGFFAAKLLKSSDNTTGAITEIPGENEQTATVDVSKLSDITEGMSADDVVALVGEPTEKQTTTTAKGHPITYWYYTDSNNEVWQIGINDDEVQVVRKY